MPTKLPRHQITETADIAAALDHAALKWPGLKRSELLRKLILAGDPHEASAEERRRQDRLRAIRESAGRHTDLYPPHYLETLHEDWPA